MLIGHYKNVVVVEKVRLAYLINGSNLLPVFPNGGATNL
jgi:hypothetical protein